VGDEEHHDAGQDEGGAGEDQRPPDPAAAGDEPADDDADGREREEDQSGVGRRVVRRAFHPLAGAGEGGVDAERDEGLAKIGAQELLVPSEHPDVDQRPAGASLPDGERCAGSDRGRKKPPGRGRETRHEQQQARDRAGEQDDAWDVEGREEGVASLPGGRCVFGNSEDGEDQGDEGVLLACSR